MKNENHDLLYKEEEEEFSRQAHIPIPGNRSSLTADWMMPPHARGVVLFAHGSGSSKLSSRNRAVARYLLSRGMGTLMLDLLTPEEERIDNVTHHIRFDIPLLAKRLVIATRWIRSQPVTSELPLGYFGASTGAAAALVAAAELQGDIEIIAVVSRGGRPDLAGNDLADVTSPTLLIVGGNDHEVLGLNKQALAQLSFTKKLSIIPGATHLFEELGALDQVQLLAADWFLKHFTLRQPVTMSAGGGER